MSFNEFQSLARLYVIGALDEEEMSSFEHARQEHGVRAEGYLRECRRLASVLALSLQPRPPLRGAKKKLLSLLRTAGRRPMVPSRPRPVRADELVD